jgi:hypothetical protein
MRTDVDFFSGDRSDFGGGELIRFKLADRSDQLIKPVRQREK